MTSAYSINLNFNNTIPVKTDFTFKQGDKGITLNLATTGLDPTGTTAHIVFKRSNGTSVEAELTGQTGPNYSYTILGNEFEIPGVVVADLKLYNGDTQRVSTASFIFLVTGDTMDGVGGGTGGYSDQLEELSQEFSDTLEEYKDAFGDVGAINPRGEYSALEEYTALDLVSYNGNSYLCREGCTGIAPTNTTYWQVFASGGGGGTDDYEDLENKPSINGVELSGNKSTGDLEIEFNDLDDVDMTGVTDGQVPTWDATEGKYKPGTPAGGGGGPNPNILDNPWFTINQRNVTSATASSSAVFLDRWHIAKATYNIESSGSVTISNCAAGFGIFQDYIEFESGQEYTVSAEISGQIYAVTFTYSGSSGYVGTLIEHLKVYVEPGKLWLSPQRNDVTFTISKVKLEKGSISTLALDIKPDYTTERLKCRRYFYRLTSAKAYKLIGLGFVETTTGAVFTYQLPTPMARRPDFSYAGTYIIYDGVTSLSATFTQNNGLSDENFSFLAATISGGTVGKIMFIYPTSDNWYMDFSAE